MAILQPIDTVAPHFVPAPISDAEAQAMFRAAVNLFARWGVGDEQASVLLDLPLRTYRRWKAGHIGRIDRDGRARLSNLMGIHKALRIIFHEPQRAYDWVSRPNAAFGGRTPLEIMLGGELTDLMRVRRFLDAERGGW
ncbi:MbcA/ParS/Xre antitoxin family protein [Chelativorans intermedius]|uniref:MbcA/ParS/Xre antitoxin family protein n=1 Tax=Chelativorans intermedius TaxID=515947 RepID=A0ABV6D5U5_9HYPH|nr:MbcA/ParS/Xre antitoxin family protein [Chelativorans intermedius]MCT8997528.1 MbcA/ParS/Xre antitoxin family protein [Chelativorans intermedius]